MSGSASWSTSNGLVNIKVSKVANLSKTRKTGSLRLRLWAVRSRYAGGSLSGYVLGTRSLNPLAANRYYSSITGKVTYRKPPSGTYFTTLTLEEYTASGWSIRDYINFSSKTKL